MFAFAATMNAVSVASCADAAQRNELVEKYWDNDWRFYLGDLEDGEMPSLNDAEWRPLDLPHDWMIEGPFVHDLPIDEFVDQMWGKVGFDPQESLSRSIQGYRAGGVGWYRKRFRSAGLAESDRRVYIRFDGVYMNADVWINGHHLGHHPYGYTPFRFDLTPYLANDTDNVLAVRVHVNQPCSRWYSGAGIYRHVWLETHAPVHIAPDGVFVTTPEVSKDRARVRLATCVRNSTDAPQNATLTTRIGDGNDELVSEHSQPLTLEANADTLVEQYLDVPDPALWSVDRPNRYKATLSLHAGHMVDSTTIPFGIRTCEFTTDRGFLLNGAQLPLRGVNLHHDQGCLGAAAYDRAIERQLELLKQMGCNAIRTAHNPPAPALLDCADRMGFVVIVEAFDEWRQPKLRNGYGNAFDEWSERDLVSMIHSARNHPSVILWSIGNEVWEQMKPEGAEIAARLAAVCRREDPSRPVTAGYNAIDHVLANGCSDPLDVLGINYNLEWHEKLRGQKPLYASETTVALSTRGAYNLVLKDNSVVAEPRIGHVHSSYDLAWLMMGPAAGAPAQENLRFFRERPWLAGQFVWAGFDYMGEPTPLKWPAHTASFGMLDTCGFPKDRYYLYQSQWSDEAMLHILPHWNHEGLEGHNIPVWCYTNCDSVELLLNGTTLDAQRTNASDSLHLAWNVPYSPGTLRAIGIKSGDKVIIDEVRTAGPPAQLALAADRLSIRPDGQDLAFVTLRVLDNAGVRCPNAANPVTFELEGPGVIAGLGNGDPTSLEEFQGNTRSAFHGVALVVVKFVPGAAADLKLSARTEALASASVLIGRAP